MVESEKDPITVMSESNKVWFFVCCVVAFFFPSFVFSLSHFLSHLTGGNGGGEKRIKLEGKW